MTSIKPHLSVKALEARYETASEPIGKSHFHAIWLLASGYSVEQVSKLLSFSKRWVKALVKRYNDGGCVYRKPKSGRSDGGVRRAPRVI